MRPVPRQPESPVGIFGSRISRCAEVWTAWIGGRVGPAPGCPGCRRRPYPDRRGGRRGGRRTWAASMNGKRRATAHDCGTGNRRGRLRATSTADIRVLDYISPLLTPSCLFGACGGCPGSLLCRDVGHGVRCPRLPEDSSSFGPSRVGYPIVAMRSAATGRATVIFGRRDSLDARQRSPAGRRTGRGHPAAGAGRGADKGHRTASRRPAGTRCGRPVAFVCAATTDFRGAFTCCRWISSGRPCRSHRATFRAGDGET